MYDYIEPNADAEVITKKRGSMVYTTIDNKKRVIYLSENSNEWDIRNIGDNR